MRLVTILRKRKFLVGLLVLAVVYVFIKYLPTDVPPAGQRIDSRTGRHQGSPLVRPGKSKEATSSGIGGGAGQFYDGPVKFYNLADTLRPHGYSRHPGRENVLFLLHDLRSAGSLTALACEMASYNKSNVHMGVISGYDTTIEDIAGVSGFQTTDCPIFWHDARPDYNTQSSRERHATSIKSALSHMNAILKPTVAIIDERQISNTFLKSALDERFEQLWLPLTVVPHDAMARMSWITTLDATGLSLLSQNQIDIIIQPYRHSAGSLFRLLESVKRADYSGLPHPRITVDLPQNIDTFALNYLEQFRWPGRSRSETSKLILRRQVDTKHLTSMISTLRTVELFYPPTQPMSHVLILSPDVELSENYMQHLYYLTLEYKYGRAGQRITRSLSGIALDLPEKTLNDQEFLNSVSVTRPGAQPLLLAQTPSSHAALYFGNHWVELQDYLTLRLKHDPELKKRVKGSPEASMSSQHPAWLGIQWELMQMRNDWMLYPQLPNGEKLVTVHTESTQSAEEFWTKPKRPSAEDIPSLEGQILVGDEVHPNVHADMDHTGPISPAISSLQLLGLSGRETLPMDSELAFINAIGEVTDIDTARQASEIYADKISMELGDCRHPGDRDDEIMGNLQYLFCDYDD